MGEETAAGLPRRRLDPTVGKARAMVGHLLGLKTTGKNRVVENPPLILVGCSGGPDSLALAAVCAFFSRRGEVRVGDMQLKAGDGAALTGAASISIEGASDAEVLLFDMV